MTPSSFRIWARAIRVRLLSASIVSVTSGLVIAWATLGIFDVWYALLTYVGVICAHASIDLLNDYFDYRSRIDLITVRTPLSGGTGVLPERLLKPKSVYRAGVILLICATCIGLILTFLRGLVVAAFLVFGILSIYFYSTKIANFGFGEVLLVFKGMLIVVGSYFVQTSTFGPAPVLVGVIMGLLSSSALYVNQFPDFEADRRCGRLNLVVRLGLRNASRAYVVYPVLIFSLIVAGVGMGVIPVFGLSAILALPFFYRVSKILTSKAFDASKAFPVMAQNVLGARFVGVVITLAYLVSAIFR